MRRLPVETVQPSYAAWNEGGSQAVADGFWAEDIVGVEDPTVPDTGEYRGRVEVARWMERLKDVFGDFRVHPEGLFEHGGRYLVEVRLEGSGPRGGVPVTEMIFHVLHVGADGRITRLENFLTRERALAALGVEG